VVGSVSVLYRFRKQFNRVAERWLEAALSGRWRTAPMVYEYTENKPPEYFSEKIKEYGGYRYTASSYTRLNEELFETFARQVAQEGVRFVVIDGPVHPRMSALVSPAADRGYHEYLARAADGVGFTYVPLNGLPPFAAPDFIDFAHLNAGGRRKLSEFMGDYMHRAVVAERDRQEKSGMDGATVAGNRKG
jgi:hypothetical protein